MTGTCSSLNKTTGERASKLALSTQLLLGKGARFGNLQCLPWGRPRIVENAHRLADYVCTSQAPCRPCPHDWSREFVSPDKHFRRLVAR